MKKISITSLLLSIIFVSFSSKADTKNATRPLKVLHIALHQGCLNDFEEVAQQLSLDVTSWYIHSNPAHFDEYAHGAAIYNIGHDRAKRVWEKHKDYFNQFDVVMTSDTAPLSRIFLQNEWKKPLIIWICNRFDYCDYSSLDCQFPDQEYYNLIRNAVHQSNVKIVSYTPYEYHYAATKGINIGTRTIKPIGCLPKTTTKDFKSAISADINKQDTLFLYPRLEPNQIKFVEQQCAQQGIVTYSGVYNGPQDLKNFKGVIYFPYQWSNLALFENIQNGLIHFIPSKRFIAENQHRIRYCTLNNFDLCEWYCSEYQDLFVYFDSWQDLKEKMKTTDYDAMSNKIKSRAQQHRTTMLTRWQELFDECKQFLN